MDTYTDEQIEEMITKHYVNYCVWNPDDTKHRMSEEEHKQYWLDHVNNYRKEHREFYLSRLEWFSAPIEEINKRWFHFGA